MKIIKNSKAVNILLISLSAVLMLIIVFLITIAFIFHSGNNAPNIFGSNIYLVKTDAFDIIKNGSAIITNDVPYEEILVGNIVIYNDEKYQAQIAEVHEVAFSDGVFTFKVKRDNGSDTFIGQSAIIGKAMSYSTFLGGVISFATSPLGLLIIVIIPCIIVIVSEILKAVRSKNPREVKTVDKLLETPTYSPHPTKRKSDDDDDNESSFTPLKNPAAMSAINAYKEAAEESPLFTPPKRVVKQVQAEPPSSKKLENAIAEAKAEREKTLKSINSLKQLEERDPSSTGNIKLDHTLSIKSELLSQPKPKAPVTVPAPPPIQPTPKRTIPTPSGKTEFTPPQPKPAPEKSLVKEYVPAPKKETPIEKKAIPLDKLLHEEKEVARKYNIDDILKSLEKR